MNFKHEDITGGYLDAMPRLIGKEGHFAPADALWEMKRRINAWQQFQADEIKEKALLQVFGNWRATGDGIVAMFDGGVKIVPHSPALIAVTRNTMLVDHGIGHAEDPYPNVKAIPARIVKKKFDRNLRQGEAKDHEGWIHLAQGEVQVVADYEDAIVGVRKLKGYSTEEILPFYAFYGSESVKEIHVEGTAVLAHFNDPFLDCRRGGVYNMGLKTRAPLAGVAPKALGLEPRSGALGLSIDDAVQRVYALLQPYLSEANPEQVQAVLCGALVPVLTVRDEAYRKRVIMSVRTLAADYLGPKPLAELETQLAALQRK